MIDLHYCVSVTQLDGFHTYGFQRPVDLVRFLAHHNSVFARRASDSFRIVCVNRLFEIPIQRPVLLGTLSADRHFRARFRPPAPGSRFLSARSACLTPDISAAKFPRVSDTVDRYSRGTHPPSSP